MIEILVFFGVFGVQLGGERLGAEQQVADWETVKAAERAARDEGRVLDGVAPGLPALLRAAKLQKRAARHGAALQGADAAALADAAENLQTAQPASAQAEQAVGELLFAAANLARQAGVDPEQALQKANEAFCTAAGPVA